MDRIKELMGYHHYDEILVERLRDLGFFDAPASRKYHGSYRGGLFDHSFKVTQHLVSITENEGLRWRDPRSPYIVGLLHDLCKYDQYIIMPDRYDRRDILTDGQILWNPKQEYSGHGDKSVLLCQAKLGLDLTEEEALCIRWHMGAFDKEENWRGYTDAIHKYQNVLWTHTADMLASHVDGI